MSNAIVTLFWLGILIGSNVKVHSLQYEHLRKRDCNIGINLMHKSFHCSNDDLRIQVKNPKLQCDSGERSPNGCSLGTDSIFSADCE